MDPITIKLTKSEMEQCVSFSEESAKTQQKIEFGQGDTAPRSVKEIARDNLIGKMAEVAFKRFLHDRYEIETAVDFNIYERGIWDDNDLSINGWEIDIKSTRVGSWFLIEWSKLSFRRKQNKLPDCFFICKTPWNMNNDTPHGTVELWGAVSLKTLCSNDSRIQILRKGELLPGTKHPTRLQADNFGIRFKHITHDWDKIISYMKKNKPKDPNQFVHFPFE